MLGSSARQVEAFTGLRSQGVVPVAQESSLRTKNIHGENNNNQDHTNLQEVGSKELYSTKNYYKVLKSLPETLNFQELLQSPQKPTRLSQGKSRQKKLTCLQKNDYRGVVVIIFIHHIDTPKESVQEHRKREF